MLGTIPAQNVTPDVAISPDASMLAYTIDNGFETVSLAAGTGRRWTPATWPRSACRGEVTGLSGSSGRRPTTPIRRHRHPGARRHRAWQPAAGVLARHPVRLVLRRAGGCQDNPVLTADGSRVLVTRAVAHGSRYTDSVVEYSTRTGRLVATLPMYGTNLLPFAW